MSSRVTGWLVWGARSALASGPTGGYSTAQSNGLGNVLILTRGLTGRDRAALQAAFVFSAGPQPDGLG
jgi:hypothetical protein